jgi:hypothetical protein
MLGVDRLDESSMFDPHDEDPRPPFKKIPG